MSNNFKCPNCNTEHYIPEFIVMTSGKYVHKKTKKDIVCLNCNTNLKYTAIKRGIPTIGSNKQEQKDLIKKRAKNHYNKEIKERKYEMHKQSIDSLKN